MLLAAHCDCLLTSDSEIFWLITIYAVTSIKHYCYNRFMSQPTTTWVNRYHSGEPVPEEIFTHSPILIIIQPLPLNLYQLLPTTMIHTILLFQFMCQTILCTTTLHILFGLPLGLEPSTSIHFFTQSVSSFCNICPYHHNLFCCNYLMLLQSWPLFI